MRGVVVAEIHALDRRAFLREPSHSEITRVESVCSEVDDLVPLPAALEELRAAELTRRHRNLPLGAWVYVPHFSSCCKRVLGFADGRFR